MDYTDYGFGKYLTVSIGVSGDNYTSAYDFQLNTADGAVTTSKIRNLYADKITAGVLYSSDGKTYFDLDNDVQIVNDGANDRVLLGKQPGGF